MINLSAGLLVKLATIAQLIDEAPASDPSKNIGPARALLADRDVARFLDTMHREGLLPDTSAHIPAHGGGVS